VNRRVYTGSIHLGSRNLDLIASRSSAVSVRRQCHVDGALVCLIYILRVNLADSG